jgi:hypothetical protein
MRYGICTKLRDRKSAKPSACRYFGKTPFSREVRIIGLSEDLNAELTESRPFLELKPFDRPLRSSRLTAAEECVGDQGEDYVYG